MTDDPTKALVKYRIERAEETYKEALLMRTEDHWNACANRLYYACFYAVSALLVKYGLSSSKHSGIKSLFNQYILKKEILIKIRENSIISYSKLGKKVIMLTLYLLIVI
jgi:uncharacterized protein (UPF0332 family)